MTLILCYIRFDSKLTWSNDAHEDTVLGVSAEYVWMMLWHNNSDLVLKLHFFF